jgi:hypothetical protein
MLVVRGNTRIKAIDNLFILPLKPVQLGKE